MKVTFITGHLCKERHALLNELALDLGKYGAEVTVLTGFPSRRISEEVRDYYLAHPIEQIAPNVTVRRIGSRKGEGNGLFQRMLRYLVLTKVLYNEAKKTETDVYYIYSSPPFLGWIGTKLTKYAPTLYNAQDLFPDTLMKTKGYTEWNPLITFLRKMEKMVYKKNTRIVTITEEMKRKLVCDGADPDNVSVIYNWADLNSIHYVQRKDNMLMNELGIDKSKFIVSYAGDIGLFQGWPSIVETAKLLCSYKEIHFAIIGSGSYKAKLEQKVKNENITNISIYPLQPVSRLSEIYSIGDLELVAIEPGLTKMALPSKTFVIMAAGKAILSLIDQTSDIAEAIKRDNLGFTLEHGNIQGLADMILDAYKRRNELSDMGDNARKYVEINANRKIQTKRYYDTLAAIAKV